MQKKWLVPGARLRSDTAASRAGAQMVLNANIWVPPSHHMVTEIIMALCKDAETATQGRVKCNLLPKAVVARAADLRRGPRWPGRQSASSSRATRPAGSC